MEGKSTEQWNESLEYHYSLSSFHNTKQYTLTSFGFQETRVKVLKWKVRGTLLSFIAFPPRCLCNFKLEEEYII